MKDRLYPGDYLRQNEALVSRNGKYQLVYQGDGNLVVYGPSGALWNTGTFSSPGFFILQGDGNAVVYDASGVAKWATYAPGPAGCFVMQDDGNLVQYNSQGTAVWSR